MSNTTNLALPLMTGAQSQKHITHNDALLILDAVVQATVTSVTLTAPPGSPTEGVCYVVAASPTGAWSGKANNIAVFVSGAWRFIEPKTGWSIWNLTMGSTLRWNGTSWAPTITTDGYQVVATDAAFTINPADAAETRHTGTLTANRACTLGTSGAIVGQRKRLTRTGGGAFNITFAGKSVATNQWAEAVYDGAAWYLAAFGSL
jgi:hypothetical protein